jgi:hypothetical protein
MPDSSPRCSVPLRESAESGDRLATLRDLRDLLAIQIEACDSLRDLASLSGRLQAVMDQIAELEPQKVEGDGVDEITARRAARRASSPKNPSRSKRSG